jgi:hypothetical protein
MAARQQAYGDGPRAVHAPRFGSCLQFARRYCAPSEKEKVLQAFLSVLDQRHSPGVCLRKGLAPPGGFKRRNPPIRRRPGHDGRLLERKEIACRGEEAPRFSEPNRHGWNCGCTAKHPTRICSQTEVDPHNTGGPP